MTQRSLQRPGGDTLAATGNHACSAACRRLSRLARPRLSSRAGEHRKTGKTIRLTCSYLNLLVSDIVFANADIEKHTPFGEITEGIYDSIPSIDVKDLFFTVQEALPLLPDSVIFAVLRYCIVSVKIQHPTYLSSQMPVAV